MNVKRFWLFFSIILVSCQISVGDKSPFVRNYSHNKTNNKVSSVLWSDNNSTKTTSIQQSNKINHSDSFYLEDIRIEKISTGGTMYGRKIPHSQLQSLKSENTAFSLAELQLNDLLDDYVLNNSFKYDNDKKIYSYKINNQLNPNIQISEAKRFIKKKMLGAGGVFSFFKDKPIVTPVSADGIGGCKDDNLSHFFVSFVQSCRALKRNKYRKNISTSSLFLGTRDQWLVVCNEAELLMNEFYKDGDKKKTDSDVIRNFLYEYFVQFKVEDPKKQSRFTGYYAFNIPVSLQKTNDYKYPIYSRPDECKSSVGCFSRSEIDIEHKINPKYIKLWARNLADIYRLQLQGSGVGLFDDGSIVYIHNTGGNYRSYVSFYDIYLKNKKKYPQLTGKNYSQLMSWLSENENQHDAAKIFAYNPSYMFFDYSYENNIKGAEGSILTPGRSLAVDNKVIPYTVPVCLTTKFPVIDIDTGKYIDVGRMMMAQDTGAAIDGFVRADVFFGYNDKASKLANYMDFEGSWIIFVPKIAVKE